MIFFSLAGRPPAGRRPMKRFLKISKKAQNKKLKMIIKNPARPFCHKYISLPFHNKTLRKKWIPASKSKMKSLRFSAAGRKKKTSRTGVETVGVNTFPKIICIACRTVPIQSALCSPDLGECFRYPQRVCNMRKKFPRGL